MPELPNLLFKSNYAVIEFFSRLLLANVAKPSNSTILDILDDGVEVWWLVVVLITDWIDFIT